jgi:hypothetical protein
VPIFIPPTDNLLQYTDRTQPYGLGYRLFRFFSPEPRGRNVYKLSDGSFTEIEQSDLSNVVKLFHGGSSHYVSDVEAAELVAAGYVVQVGEFELGSSFSSTLASGATLGVTDADRGL